MDMEKFARLVSDLKTAGALRKMLNEDGSIKPSKSADLHVMREYPNASDEQKLRLAHAHTLIEVAERYRIDVN
jgi:hypothetical protein